MTQRILFRHSSWPAQKIRKYTFWTVLSLVALGTILIAALSPTFIDVALWLYYCTAVVGLAALWLFLDYWWIMSRTAGHIFACITGLIAVIVFRAITDIVAAHMRLSGDIMAWKEFTESFEWQLRMAPQILIVVWMFAYIFGRWNSGNDDY